MLIRPFREADREAIKTITAICFEGVAIDHAIEVRYGLVDGKDWRYRKVRHIDADIAANAAGIFVAEIDGVVIGYITTRIDPETKVGSIPNLGVLPAQRGAGLGRRLIETAIAYAKGQGMLHLRIETLAHNAIGQHLYPSCGFQEVAQQVHYVLPLESKD
ncbi:MAG: GNAT family N-acetyltransferase [Caldilineaceae bacterium]|nr:GNAT family N-acetyltransferase [Caldilineaceae bacterium]